MAYAHDKETLHLWLQTAKNDFTSVSLYYGDPFNYEPSLDNPEHYVWVVEGQENKEMKKMFSSADYDFYFIAIKPDYKRTKYAFILNDTLHTYLYGCRETYLLEGKDANLKKYNLFNYFNFPYINPEDVITPPDWVKDTIWYQIFPDRFARGELTKPDHVLPFGSITENVSNHMHFGGDLKGIIEKLDYIASLGATGIYFTPIFEAQSTHKYDTIDYFKIDPQFGTNASFKHLVKEAHKRGIRVMLDAVFNHCGFYHPFFQDVLKNKESSPYYDCFYIHGDPTATLDFDANGHLIKNEKLRQKPNYETFAFTPMMPKWNTAHPIVREHLLEVSRYWIKEFDIDGWRLDVSNEVSHDFWRAFRKTVLAAKEDCFILGENWDDSSPWLQGDQLDAVMNYELLFPIWQFFTFEDKTPRIHASQFKDLVNQLFIKYPFRVLESMFNLVGCHDTSRILNRVKENSDLVKLPFLFMFTFPGAPNIYYGDEIGLTGGHDPDNRRCMIWDEKKQNTDMQTFIKTLIHLRKTYDAFKSLDFEWILADDEHETLIYAKKSQKETVYIFINNQKCVNIISTPEQLIGLTLWDAFTSHEVTLGKHIKLGEYAYKVIIQKK